MKKTTFLLVIALCITANLYAKNLSRNEVEALKTTIANEWTESTRQQYAEAWNGMDIVINQRKMPFWKAVYGQKPADGRSLYISLHGGGQCPPDVNDQQWDNQKYLYRPKEGVYIAPRAPYDDWNMWCKTALDAYYRQLIEMCVAYLDVNPDKVYLLGYSAGGDGVWRMAPRMADTWAAASMMAGHPGNVSMLNLRNLPYMIWCGALDDAYDRNKLDTYRGQQIDSLQTADPEGYVHQTHIMKGMGHWMNRADTVAIGWMSGFVRNPYPKKIVWRQEEVVRPYFYWISAPKSELKWGNTVRLECKDNTIDISECDYTSLTLWLNDDIVDLDRKVTIKHNGHTLFCGKLKRTEADMRQSINERGDLRYIFPAHITIRL